MAFAESALFFGQFAESRVDSAINATDSATLDAASWRHFAQSCKKIIFTILFLFVFSEFAFAAGAGIKHSDKQYRCFAEIGKSQTTERDWITNNYCLPSPQTTTCKKEWEWSLDGKDDGVTEVGNNCKFACATGNNTLGTGSKNPFETYQYCVYNPDWGKVSKCVDKDTGEDVADTSKCESDMGGKRYYYKPKCDKGMTKEQCENHLKSISVRYGWRFCYYYTEPAPPGDLRQQKGGKSVLFQEYINQQGTASFPCNQMSSSPGGGGISKPKEDKPLVIIDWDDDKQVKSKIHTKVSGTGASFKLYTQVGALKSGLKSASCEVTFSDGSIAVKKSPAKIDVWSWGSAWASRFDTPNMAFTKSGIYTIECRGVDTDGNNVAGKEEFLVAPYSYEFRSVSVEFDNTTSNKSQYGKIIEPLITETKRGNFGTIIESKHASVGDNNKKADWRVKPVIKIGSSMNILINQIIAQTKQLAIDNGVDSASVKVGMAKVKGIGGILTTEMTLNSKDNPNPYAIKGINPPNISASHSCSTTLTQAPNATQAEMLLGTFALTSPFPALALTSNNVLAGRAEIVIYDKAMSELIDEQKGMGLCDDSAKFPCPYPAKLKTIFDYQVAPNNFKAELLDKNNNPIKVLYFGQGNSPLADSATKIRVSALSDKDNIAKDFNTNCAAQDMTLNMELSGQGFSIKVIDSDGKDFIIKGSDFKDGIANVEGILQVNKDKDVPFTPNMKSEPVFTQDKYPNGFPANMEFAGFAPADTYYPSYKDVSVNPNDPLMILRGRINAIDTDNNATNFGIASPTKVYYEFQCEYCDLDKVAKVTGWARYDNKDKSPTQQGWWIDRTFDKYNETKLEKTKAEIENLGNAQINNISAHSKGEQAISYSFLGVGTYKLNIRHGNFKDAMPYFLLYNAYWSGEMKEVVDKDGNKARYLESGTKWHTSAFIHINGAAKDENRDYGVDTKGAKNTRSGGRIGKY